MENNKELINNKKYKKEYEFITVNFATGDQFKKIATLCSENGPITLEQANKFYDEAAQEAQEWQEGHPGESVVIRDLEGEDGKRKQIIETTPKSDLIFPSGFRSRIYDQNGKQIVGKENIRKEIKRRETQWEQWKKEGKLEKVNHEVHHTDDGSTVSVFTLLPPADAEKLHPNEINDETMWIPLGVVEKKIESGKESQQIDENKISTSERSSKNEEHVGENTAVGSNKEENINENRTNKGGNKEESVQKENVEDTNIVAKIKKNINEWSVKKTRFYLE